MLDDRELRVLAGIERNLSTRRPDLIVCWSKGGDPGCLRCCWASVSSASSCCLFLAAQRRLAGPARPRPIGGAHAYGLFRIPVHPDLPARPAAKDGGSDDHGGVWQEREVFRAEIERRRGADDEPVHDELGELRAGEAAREQDRADARLARRTRRER